MTEVETRKRSFWTKLTIGYVVVGAIGGVLLFFKAPGVALYTAIWWLLIGIGLVLVSYGTDNQERTLGKAARIVGWIWLALVAGLVSVTQNPVFQGQ